MSKHTKGPWMVNVEDGEEWWFGGSENKMQAVIRPQGSPHHKPIAVYGFDVGADNEAVVRANMNLIAAAPDLLEALERINILTSPGNRTMDELMRDMGLACDRARTAIAKAKGEA